jgi:hypothetical protein
MRLFRIGVVLPMAILAVEDDPDPLVRPLSTPLADRARAAVARVSRRDVEVRDALSALLDAVNGLERSFDRLHAELELRARGIELRPRMVQIGGDGMTLSAALPFAHGAGVRVYFSLHVRDGPRFFAFTGHAKRLEGGAEIAFEGISSEDRDLIVAFVFQEEAKERRRVREINEP